MHPPHSRCVIMFHRYYSIPFLLSYLIHYCISADVSAMFHISCTALLSEVIRADVLQFSPLFYIYVPAQSPMMCFSSLSRSSDH